MHASVRSRAEVPPYFSLAVTEVEIGAWSPTDRKPRLPYRLRVSALQTHLRSAPTGYAGGPPRIRVWGERHGMGAHRATVFAIHPVAVYGAAYLIQRTVVLATLFSMLSILLFVRGLRGAGTPTPCRRR